MIYRTWEIWKIGEFGELWAVCRNSPCQCTENVFGICTDCSLFAKIFLTKCFYLYSSPNFFPAKYFPCMVLVVNSDQSQMIVNTIDNCLVSSMLWYCIICTSCVYEPLQIDSINGTMIANQFVRVGGSLRNQTMISFDNGAQWQKIGAGTSSCVLVRL